MEAARALQQQEIIEWLIPDMAQGMRVEHDRLAQLGWVYDGFGGYRKKAASSHPGPKFAACNVQVNGGFRPSNQLSLFVFAGEFDAHGGPFNRGPASIGAKGERAALKFFLGSADLDFHLHHHGAIEGPQAGVLEALMTSGRLQ